MFASLSASGDVKSGTGLYMAVATLLGSGLFVTNFVFGMVVYNAKGRVMVTPQFITRDILFYVISILFLLYALLIRGHLDMIFSGALIIWYIM